MNLSDLTDEEKLKLNELLSRSTIQSRGDMGYLNGEANLPLSRLMDGPRPLTPDQSYGLQQDNSEPGVQFNHPQTPVAQPQMPQNYVQRGNAAPIDLGPSVRQYDIYRGGPQVLDSRQLPDGRTLQRVRVATIDGFGRQSSDIMERLVTPDYLNPAAIAQQKFEAAKAQIAHTKAQTAAAQQKPTEPEALRTIKGAMEIYKSLPEGDMKRAFGEKHGLETKGVDEQTLPAGAVATIGAAGTSVENMSRSRNTFKNDYAGKTILGDLSNTIGRVFGDETGQAQWWQDFDVAQAQARHALFGSALTNTEKAAWEKISINPRMDPEEIRKNLQRRQAIEERAASKLARAYAAGGYSKAQIKELLGSSASFLDTAAPPVTTPSGPVQITNPNDAMKLPSGTKFIDPNGVLRVRP